MGIKIQKEKIPVVVMTTQYRMEAEIHVVSGGRLLDELNKERDFVPLTGVTVYDLHGGNPLDTIDFLAVNKRSVIFVAPAVSVSEAPGVVEPG